jgi:hypothetical protein
VHVPNRNRIDGAGIARAQQPVALDVARIPNTAVPLSSGANASGAGDAIAKPTQGAVDADPEIPDLTLLEVAHIPSSPNSARAVSMTAGVISVIPRSFA